VLGVPVWVAPDVDLSILGSSSSVTTLAKISSRLSRPQLLGRRPRHEQVPIVETGSIQDG
jgi:hypothetical protein